MTFTTLETITEDILKIVRGSIVSTSEPISKRQVEDWVHQYRAVLLRRNLDKGQYPNPDFIQMIPYLELEKVQAGRFEAVPDFPLEFDFALQSDSSEDYFLRTKLTLPKTIDLSYKSGITWVGTGYGKEIQLVPQHRERWQTYKRYTPNDIVCFLNGGRLYFRSLDDTVKYVTVRGIFENPMEVGRFSNPQIDLPYMDGNSPYPIPVHLLDPLKEMILEKELGIMVKSPSDTKNDSIHGVDQNEEHKFVI